MVFNRSKCQCKCFLRPCPWTVNILDSMCKNRRCKRKKEKLIYGWNAYKKFLYRIFWASFSMPLWFSRHPRPLIQYWLWCRYSLLTQHAYTLTQTREWEIYMKSDEFSWLFLSNHQRCRCDFDVLNVDIIHKPRLLAVCRIEMQSHEIHVISLNQLSAIAISYSLYVYSRSVYTMKWIFACIDGCRWCQINASRWFMAIGYDECWLYERTMQSIECFLIK